MGLGDASGFNVFGNGTINDNNWHHVAASVNRSGYMTLYRDGVFDNQTSISAYSAQNENNTIPFNIGGKSTALGSTVNGSIDDVRVYSQALSLSQIQQLYAQGLPKHQIARR